MLTFDGEERFRRVRQERTLGALRREGFQPARRHPSASRRRTDTAVEGFADRVYCGLHDGLPSTEDSKRASSNHIKPLSTVSSGFVGNFMTTSPNMGMQTFCESVSQPEGQVRCHGFAVRERSCSAPPLRAMPTSTMSHSLNMKVQRASTAARKLSQIESVHLDPFQRPEIQKLYMWLKGISLQEYLPALLQVRIPSV
jgi:hypothetical protein